MNEILRIRLAIGVTQSEMAKILGRSVSYVSLMETDKREIADQTLRQLELIEIVHNMSSHRLDQWLIAIGIDRPWMTMGDET